VPSVVFRVLSPVDLRGESALRALRGQASATRHEELIRLCAAGDTEGAAAVAYDTWHSLSSAEDRRPTGVTGR